VQIATTGTGKLLSITCSPDSKNFGNVPVGDSKVDKITCRNSDSAAIDFVTGFTDFPDDWSIDPTASSISPAMGGDEGVVTLSLTFKPTTTGPRTSTLNIKTKDGILIGTVDLDGNGTTPPKDKTMMNIGCAYSGRTAPTPLALAMFVLAGGLLLRRRRRTA
jgi:MYXO-CTERM domain-containing protein